jgi:hypothetical protein
LVDYHIRENLPSFHSPARKAMLRICVGSQLHAGKAEAVAVKILQKMGIEKVNQDWMI